MTDPDKLDLCELVVPIWPCGSCGKLMKVEKCAREEGVLYMKCSLCGKWNSIGVFTAHEVKG